MLQNGSCQNSHLSINVIFQNKEKRIYENATALYAPDWESIFMSHYNSIEIIKSGKNKKEYNKTRAINWEVRR